MNTTPHQDFPSISSIVSELRTIRDEAYGIHNREHPLTRLPSKKALKKIIYSIATALYPNRLGNGDLNASSVDYFVGYTLDSTLRELNEQIRRELDFNQQLTKHARKDLANKAKELTRQFANALPKIRAILDSDLQAAFEGDPAARSVDEVLVCYPGITAITFHRIAHELFILGLPLVARIISEVSHSNTSIDIHPGATIGHSFFIDHGTGVVIGETAVIGDRVRLYQAVTLGAKRFPTDENGVLLKGNERHPILEDDVVIYAGATVLGRITIGKGSSIGGNVWLTRSVPPDSNITQAQVRRDVFIDGAGI